MAKKRYGLKEVADVVFFDIVTNKPVAFFDTLKVSTLENEAEQAEARGGQGNPKRISWDYNRTATMSISDALLSETTLKMLAGNETITENITLVGHEKLDVNGDLQVKLSNAITDITKLTVFANESGLMGEELDGAHTINADVGLPAGDAGKVIDLVGTTSGQKVIVFYEYTKASGANQIVFSGDKFPSTYGVVGSTFVRDENGVDHVMQFEIGKAKMQSGFSLTMDVENVATFDFSLEVLVDESGDMYKLTRVDA